MSIQVPRCPARSSDVNPGRHMPSQVLRCQSRSPYAQPGPQMSIQVTICPARSPDAQPGHQMPIQVAICPARSPDIQPGPQMPRQVPRCPARSPDIQLGPQMPSQVRRYPTRSPDALQCLQLHTRSTHPMMLVAILLPTKLTSHKYSHTEAHQWLIDDLSKTSRALCPCSRKYKFIYDARHNLLDSCWSEFT